MFVLVKQLIRYEEPETQVGVNNPRNKSIYNDQLDQLIED